MEKVELKAETRQEKGKEAVKKIRKKGYIPAVVYDKESNILVKIPLEEAKKLKSLHFSENALFDLQISGEGQDAKSRTPVLIKEVQYHPLTDEAIHLDFVKVSLKEKIKLNIPIVLKGEAKGVKEGGTVEQILREVEIECYPQNIPEKIIVDISSLELGQSLHLGQVNMPEGVKLISSLEETVVTVVAPEAEEEAPAAEEPETPEVIKEKAKEEAPGQEKEKK